MYIFEQGKHHHTTFVVMPTVPQPPTHHSVEYTPIQHTNTHTRARARHCPINIPTATECSSHRTRKTKNSLHLTFANHRKPTTKPNATTHALPAGPWTAGRWSGAWSNGNTAGVRARAEMRVARVHNSGQTYVNWRGQSARRARLSTDNRTDMGVTVGPASQPATCVCV